MYRYLRRRNELNYFFGTKASFEFPSLCPLQFTPAICSRIYKPSITFYFRFASCPSW